jgi:hypothetical protein
MKTMKLSDRTKLEIEAAAEECAQALIKTMDFTEIGSLRVSIDLNRDGPGPICGIKVTATRIEACELLWDKDRGALNA